MDDPPLRADLAQVWAEALSDPNLDVWNHPVLFPLQRRNEHRAMINAARTIGPKTIVEIGADKGGSAYLWLKEFPRLERMCIIEPRGVPYSDAFRKQFPKVDLAPIETSSRDYVKFRLLTRWFWTGLIDVLFIDGQKACFIDDFFTYRPWVRSGGLIFMHDICCEPMSSHYNWACAAEGVNSEGYIDRSEPIPMTEYGGWLRSPTSQASCGVGVIRCK